eukprot:CAMPEP_0176404298 /NCGR_PEP_ID=MMETSP0126-20121128/50753_1 /TAXON_ID=141414 ORGANISM="Strombidinopsis acuminatum, Strain SPMC142" /NCGR_SAMPLE_ID=MMETSP0126 /ASSEMBLY_ACC=CAM_ASM_000229 /LENGTH=38 /DNA_ID= /DNA_START= /DNA_END= /DNA_ORIENTATION=
MNVDEIETNSGPDGRNINLSTDVVDHTKQVRASGAVSN